MIYAYNGKVVYVYFKGQLGFMVTDTLTEMTGRLAGLQQLTNLQFLRSDY